MYYLSIYSDPDTLKFIKSKCGFYESREEMEKRLSAPREHYMGKLEVFIALRNPVALLLFDNENFADLFQHETIEDAINSLQLAHTTINHNIKLNSIYQDGAPFLILAPKHMIEEYVNNKKIKTSSYLYNVKIMFFVLITMLLLKCLI